MDQQDPERICPSCQGRKSPQAERCAACTGAGHTSEQRDRLSTPLCGANKKDGTKCRAFAGQGTEHKGIGRCRFHGGSTPNHNTHAINEEIKKRAAAFGDPIDVTAPEALMSTLRATAGHVQILHSEISEMEDRDSREFRITYGLYSQERDRLTRIGEAAVRAGVSERLVRIEESQAAMTVKAVADAARDIGLDRTRLRALGVALRVRLAEAAGEQEQADASRQRLDRLREEITATDDQRIAAAAQREAERLTGLMIPPAELIPIPDAE